MSCYTEIDAEYESGDYRCHWLQAGTLFIKSLAVFVVSRMILSVARRRLLGYARVRDTRALPLRSR